jgi:hypothetical protein
LLARYGTLYGLACAVALIIGVFRGAVDVSFRSRHPLGEWCGEWLSAPELPQACDSPQAHADKEGSPAYWLAAADAIYGPFPEESIARDLEDLRLSPYAFLAPTWLGPWRSASHVLGHMVSDTRREWWALHTQWIQWVAGTVGVSEIHADYAVSCCEGDYERAAAVLAEGVSWEVERFLGVGDTWIDRVFGDVATPPSWLELALLAPAYGIVGVLLGLWGWLAGTRRSTEYWGIRCALICALWLAVLWLLARFC